MADERLPVGTTANFKGYAEEGIEAMLDIGQLVIIAKDGGPQNGYEVHAIDDEGNKLNAAGGIWNEGEDLMGDTLFEQEMENINTNPEAGEAAPATTAEETTTEEETTETPADEFPEDITEEYVNGLSGPKLAALLAAEGFDLPRGWSSLSIANKRSTTVDILFNDPDEGSEAPAEEPTEETTEETTEEATAETVEETGDDGVEEATPAPVNRHGIGGNGGPPLEHSEEVQALIDQNDNIVGTAIDMANQTAYTEYRLGGLLWEIFEKKLYEGLGYKGKTGYAQFCDEQLKIHPRKGQYLKNIYEMCRKTGISEGQVVSMGWSKAAQLARIPVDQLLANMEDLLEKADSMTRDDLIDHITERYDVSTRGESVKTTTFKFSVHETEAEVINDALELAKSQVEEGDLNRAFILMCSNFSNEGQGSDLDLETFMQLGIARFGADVLREQLGVTQPETSDDQPDENPQPAEERETENA